MEKGTEDAYTCPSFSSYSSDRLAEIAVRVAAEEIGDDDDGDFEFSLVREDKEFSAEEFVGGGQFGPVFPVFNRDLESRVRLPLGKLFVADRDGDGDNPSSCTSSEADELENIPVGSYCVWRPEVSDQPSPGRCKKSKSAGSASRGWRFLDLLRRSSSDGKESFVFLTPRNRGEKSPAEIPRKLKEKGGTTAAVVARSAHEALYVRNRAIKEVDRKKSYLPYRQDLVGFFVNVNVLGKGFPHL